jgi:hypothetical protein
MRALNYGKNVYHILSQDPKSVHFSDVFKSQVSATNRGELLPKNSKKQS